jgi:hypothetical protein
VRSISINMEEVAPPRELMQYGGAGMKIRLVQGHAAKSWVPRDEGTAVKVSFPLLDKVASLDASHWENW